MSERTSSLLILVGGALAVLALWGISMLVVRWDSRRRRLPPLEQKAWLAVTALLPLFGFALYLTQRVLRRYLGFQPEQFMDEEAEARMTAVKARSNGRSYGTIDAAGLAREGAAQPQGGRVAARGASHGADPSTAQPPAAPDTDENRPRYALVALEGPHLGQQFILQRLPARIGRGLDAAVPLDADLNVSRNHAELYAWNGRLRIRDLQSTHGTLVNGRPVTDQPLGPGDRINVGSSVLIVREA